MYSACLYRRTKIIHQRHLRHKTVISAIHFPSRRGFSHCHFRKFAINLLNFKTSITSTRMLALSSNWDENKDKVSEKSHKIVLPLSYLLAAPFCLPQTRDKKHFNDASIHRVAESTVLLCCADVHSVPLYSSVHDFTSVTGIWSGHEFSTKAVALENLRNELRSDPVSALQLCELAYSTAWSSFFGNDGFVFDFVSILNNSTNVEF